MHTTQLDSNYLLDSTLSVELYEEIKALPVIDYFARLDPGILQKDPKFEEVHNLWLAPDPIKGPYRDHYSPKETFLAWVERLKFQVLHPVYAWSHLELFQYWGIDEFLTENNAERIYESIREQLQAGHFSPSYFVQENNLEALFVPTDLLDPLPKKEQFSHISARIHPIFSPIHVLIVDSTEEFNAYMNRLSTHTGFKLDHYIDLLNALHHSMDLFAEAGCRMAHHRLELMYAEDFTQEEVNFIFHKIRLGHELLPVEKAKYRSALLFHLSEMYYERKWVQQYYLGTIRKLRSQETGFDAMGDDETAWYLLRYLHEMSGKGKLPRTLFYHPNKSSLIASIATKFNDKWGPGWVQVRPAWEHMTSHLQLERTLLDINFTGSLRYFSGMPSSAQAFPSLMRHDFFRRRMCSFLATEAQKGHFPGTKKAILPLLKQLVSLGGMEYFKQS